MPPIDPPAGTHSIILLLSNKPGFAILGLRVTAGLFAFSSLVLLRPIVPQLRQEYRKFFVNYEN